MTSNVTSLGYFVKEAAAINATTLLRSRCICLQCLLDCFFTQLVPSGDDAREVTHSLLVTEYSDL